MSNDNKKTTPLSFTFYVDDNGLLTCLIQASIEKVMPVQTLEILGGTLRPLLYQGAVMGQRSTQIAISPSSHLQLSCS